MKSVKIYSTTWCHWCKLAREFFKENHVPFDDINVEENEKAAEEMIKKSGQTGVPVIDIGGKVIVGFDKAAIKKELGLK